MSSVKELGCHLWVAVTCSLGPTVFLMLRHPMGLSSCCERPSCGTESSDSLPDNLCRPAGSRKQWPAPWRVPAWFGSPHSSRQLALKCSHLKAPVLYPATLLEHFPVAPSKMLPFLFLTSLISSNTPCAAQTCWLPYSQDLEFQSGRLRSRLRAGAALLLWQSWALTLS